MVSGNETVNADAGSHLAIWLCCCWSFLRPAAVSNAFNGLPVAAGHSLRRGAAFGNGDGIFIVNIVDVQYLIAGPMAVHRVKKRPGQ